MLNAFSPFVFVYKTLSELDRKLSKPAKLPAPVISIGNITWGGTGKTPVVIKLARDLENLGLKPVVLSRGYKRKGSAARSVVVSDGEKTLCEPDECGDEPYLVAEALGSVVVMSGRDRVRSAEFAFKKFSPDVFIIDDGFQHWKVKRDLDIVCVNALNPFGNGFLIPAGMLREDKSSLARAGLVVVTNSDTAGIQKTKETVEEIKRHTSAPVVESRYKVTGLRRITDNKSRNIEEFSGRKVTAFSGIGETASFHKLIEKSNVIIEKSLDFPDHHWYNLNDVRSAGFRRPILTTGKDAVKLKSILGGLDAERAGMFFILDIEPEFLQGEHVWRQAIEKTARSS
ncbi:MAG: tetraacyldisaccharide 4'-kinase [Endomicrobiales bacterium]|nr:tetraacyldisaccharide 4'-kinase [Endomicrobiales bacterium]